MTIENRSENGLKFNGLAYNMYWCVLVKTCTRLGSSLIKLFEKGFINTTITHTNVRGSSRIYPTNTHQNLVCKLPTMQKLQSLIYVVKNRPKQSVKTIFVNLRKSYTCTNLQTNFIENTQIHSIKTHKNLVPKIPTVQKFESFKYTHKKRQN